MPSFDAILSAIPESDTSAAKWCQVVLDENTKPGGGPGGVGGAGPLVRRADGQAGEAARLKARRGASRCHVDPGVQAMRSEGGKNEAPMLKNTSLGRFRAIALLEGLSFVLLLFIAMPLKYLAGMPLGVKMVGWAHGMLFVLYLLFFVEVAV